VAEYFLKHCNDITMFSEIMSQSPVILFYIFNYYPDFNWYNDYSKLLWQLKSGE